MIIARIPLPVTQWPYGDYPGGRFRHLAEYRPQLQIRVGGGRSEVRRGSPVNMEWVERQGLYLRVGRRFGFVFMLVWYGDPIRIREVEWEQS